MMKKCRWKLKSSLQKRKVFITSFLLGVLINGNGFAQDGVAGINEANQKVRSYFDAGTELMYAVGAILGLIGAVKVYQKWNAGDPDTGKVAAAWFGSCVFLVVVATVIKSFFGV
jgi:phage-related protein